MGTEDGDECPELEPPGIQFTPFFQIGRWFCRPHGSNITLLRRITSDVHRPPGNSAHGKIEAGRNLRLHLFPTRCYISAPGRSRPSLETGKGGTCKNEWPSVRTRGGLSFEKGHCIHVSICVEILRGRPESRRPAEVFPIVFRAVSQHVRLSSISPPGIYSKRQIMLFNLLPEQLAGTGIIRIVESIRVSEPVAETVGDASAV